MVNTTGFAWAVTETRKKWISFHGATSHCYWHLNGQPATLETPSIWLKLKLNIFACENQWPFRRVIFIIWLSIFFFDLSSSEFCVQIGDKFFHVFFSRTNSISCWMQIRISHNLFVMAMCPREIKYKWGMESFFFSFPHRVSTQKNKQTSNKQLFGDARISFDVAYPPTAKCIVGITFLSAPSGFFQILFMQFLPSLSNLQCNNKHWGNSWRDKRSCERNANRFEFNSIFRRAFFPWTKNIFQVQNEKFVCLTVKTFDLFYMKFYAYKLRSIELTKNE